MMNDEWYGKVLAVMKDCGFDTAAIEIIDWNNIKDVADNCDEICYKVEDILNSIHHSEWGRDIFAEQIILQ